MPDLTLADVERLEKLRDRYRSRFRSHASLLREGAPIDEILESRDRAASARQMYFGALQGEDDDLLALAREALERRRDDA